MTIISLGEGVVKEGDIVTLLPIHEELRDQGMRVAIKDSGAERRQELAAEGWSWLRSVAETGDKLMHVVALLLGGVQLTTGAIVEDPVLPLRTLWTHCPPVQGRTNERAKSAAQPQCHTTTQPHSHITLSHCYASTREHSNT